MRPIHVDARGTHADRAGRGADISCDEATKEIDVHIGGRASSANSRSVSLDTQNRLSEGPPSASVAIGIGRHESCCGEIYGVDIAYILEGIEQNQASDTQRIL